MKKIIFYIPLALLLCTSCMTSNLTRGQQYSKMYEEQPTVLLVMPPINNTNNVEAKDYLYTSIMVPLAEAGYYVISPMLAMDILKAESAYDSELFVEQPLTTFKNFFGADAVVFSEINSWTKKGFGIETDIRYFIKSAATGEILFDRSCKLQLDLSVNSGGGGLAALIDLAASAINTAATDHIVAARKANYYIFRDIPRGKYSPMFLKDKEVMAEKKDVKALVK
mgnify:CR=1 FL=1